MPVHKLAAGALPASERARQVDVTPTTSSVPKGQIGVTPTSWCLFQSAFGPNRCQPYYIIYVPKGQIGVTPITLYLPSGQVAVTSTTSEDNPISHDMLAAVPIPKEKPKKSANVDVQVCKYTRKQIPLHIFSHAIIVLTCYICILVSIVLNHCCIPLQP